MMSRMQLNLADDLQLPTAKAGFSGLFSCLPREPKYNVYWSAWNGTLSRIDQWEDLGLYRRSRPEKCSPLSLAVWNMHHGAVKVLLADPRTRSLDQWTPLHLAVSNNDAQMIELLLQAGADIEGFNDRGYTPMQWAASFGLVDAITALQRGGGDMESEGRPIQPGELYERGRTPMHIAACNGQVEVIKALKQLGVEVSIKSREGWTPMHFAAENGQCDAITVLKGLGAEVSPLTNSGKTPLQIAEEWEQDKAVEMLILGAGALF
jgi:ankyrin repeat protein